MHPTTVQESLSDSENNLDHGGDKDKVLNIILRLKQLQKKQKSEIEFLKFKVKILTESLKNNLTYNEISNHIPFRNQDSKIKLYDTEIDEENEVEIDIVDLTAKIE